MQPARTSPHLLLLGNELRVSAFLQRCCASRILQHEDISTWIIYNLTLFAAGGERVGVSERVGAYSLPVHTQSRANAESYPGGSSLFLCARPSTLSKSILQAFCSTMLLPVPGKMLMSSAVLHLETLWQDTEAASRLQCSDGRQPVLEEPGSQVWDNINPQSVGLQAEHRNVQQYNAVQIAESLMIACFQAVRDGFTLSCAAAVLGMSAQCLTMRRDHLIADNEHLLVRLFASACLEFVSPGPCRPA